MASATAIAIPRFLSHSSPAKTNSSVSKPGVYFPAVPPNKPLSPLERRNQILTNLSAFPSHHHHGRVKTNKCPTPRAASSSSDYTEEPETKVKFRKSLNVPGCSVSLTLLGTGYREKVFAIIGVKVYAAGFYANPSIISKLDAWKGHASAELEQDSLVFDFVFRAPVEKSLHIVLVRDVDGKTFWDALREAISPRVESPTPVDEFALSTFRTTFQGRPLKKGTSVFLTWLDTAKMLVSISPGEAPSTVDATIESLNVTSALFDVFLGSGSVSPTLRASAYSGLAAALK